jgi:hypothetical protein
MNLKFGDIARIKKFIQARNNNNKRSREIEGADDSDDESRARLEAKKRNQNASKLVSEGILDDPLKLASLLPKNWVWGAKIKGENDAAASWNPWAKTTQKCVS